MTNELPRCLHEDVIKLIGQFQPIQDRAYPNTILGILRNPGLTTREKLVVVCRGSFVPDVVLFRFMVWCAQEAAATQTLPNTEPDLKAIADEIDRLGVWRHGLVDQVIHSGDTAVMERLTLANHLRRLPFAVKVAIGVPVIETVACAAIGDAFGCALYHTAIKLRANTASETDWRAAHIRDLNYLRELILLWIEHGDPLDPIDPLVEPDMDEYDSGTWDPAWDAPDKDA